MIGRLIALLRGRRRRNTAQLAEVGDMDDVAETVSLVPEPRKPGHLRMTHRDLRLVPKARGAATWPRRRKKVMDQATAARLFSLSMRTRDRDIRDLAADVEQLERYGLPVWQSEAEVAAAVGVSVAQLQRFSVHRLREKSLHYLTFAIPKRRGGERLIHAPKRDLKALQRSLNRELMAKLPVSEFAHGFVPGRSIRSNADPHVGKQVIVKLDLADCFPSLHFGRVRGLLIALGYAYPVATTIALVCTEPPRQPVVAAGLRYFVPVGSRTCVQGAPTSPALCNALLLRLDRRLGGLARRYDFSYTRYADDLTLSADDTVNLKRVISLARRIVREEGFIVNESKTRVQRRHARQRVTGVTVNTTAGLSRRERRKLRAALHQQARRREAGNPDVALDRRLAGRLAYLRMLNQEQAARLLRPRGVR